MIIPFNFPQKKNIENIKWGNLDVVIESSGKFKTKEKITTSY